jgi:hypothetical protein
MAKKESKDWQFVEHTVSFLEQCIDPDSKMERNVKLPVLTFPDNYRECDIVIRTGKPPREVITIVEVQARNKKVDTNMFGGWLNKKEQVGANRLICVSKHDFPKSIKDQVSVQGKNVVLMVLKDLHGEFPSNILGDISISINRPQVEFQACNMQLALTEIKGPQENMNLEPSEKNFIVNGEKMSIFDILNSFLKKYNLPEKDMCIDLELLQDGQQIFLQFVGQQIEVLSIVTRVIITWKKINVPITTYSYEQNDSGVLAWMVEGKVVEPDGEFIVKLPITKVNDNDFGIRSFFSNRTKDITGYNFDVKKRE